MDDGELDYTFHELCIIILPLLIDVPFALSLHLTLSPSVFDVVHGL